MARANPQWREAADQIALAIFSGPHAYVSPTWYEAEQVVPTWNYAAVHVYGRMQTIEDEGALLGIVQEMVRVYEQAMPWPWSFDGSTTFVKRLLAQIVGFRIEVGKIEGKFKLNQNHPGRDYKEWSCAALPHRPQPACPSGDEIQRVQPGFGQRLDGAEGCLFPLPLSCDSRPSGDEVRRGAGDLREVDDASEAGGGHVPD
jgi:hypothetical protein